jgi:hypothetical protein
MNNFPVCGVVPHAERGCTAITPQFLLPFTLCYASRSFGYRNMIETHQILSIRFRPYLPNKTETQFEVIHGACQGQNLASGPEL